MSALFGKKKKEVLKDENGNEVAVDAAGNVKAESKVEQVDVVKEAPKEIQKEKLVQPGLLEIFASSPQYAIEAEKYKVLLAILAELEKLNKTAEK